MKKKGIICLLVFIFLVQIAVPVGIIVSRRSTENKVKKEGKNYKFEITIRSISDGEIHYLLTGDTPNGDPTRKYAYIYTDSDGFSRLGVAQSHHDEEYVRLIVNDHEFFPQRTTWSTESTVPYQSFIDTKDLDPIHNARFYLLVRIYDGRPEILGIFHESGQPIDEWLQENEEAVNHWTENYGYEKWLDDH